MIAAAKRHLKILQVLLARTNGNTVDARNNKVSISAHFWQVMTHTSTETEHIQG